MNRAIRAVLALLSAAAAAATASGCGGDDGARCEMAVCDGTAAVTVRFDGVTEAATDAAAGFSYSCSGDQVYGAGTGAASCYEPAAPLMDWVTASWGVSVVATVPAGYAGCAVPRELTANMRFDAERVRPAAGAVLTQADFEIGAATLAGTPFAVMSFELEFVGATADEYTAVVRNAELHRYTVGDQTGTDGCELPAVIFVDSVAGACAVESVAPMDCR